VSSPNSAAFRLRASAEMSHRRPAFTAASMSGYSLPWTANSVVSGAIRAFGRAARGITLPSPTESSKVILGGVGMEHRLSEVEPVAERISHDLMLTRLVDGLRKRFIGPSKANDVSPDDYVRPPVPDSVGAVRRGLRAMRSRGLHDWRVAMRRAATRAMYEGSLADPSDRNPYVGRSLVLAKLWQRGYMRMLRVRIDTGFAMVRYHEAAHRPKQW
jgi:hypothetical protein